jgi:hypothetical protein
MAFISNGTTILDAGAFSVSLGSMVLLSEQTASASTSISFTSGIDSTYPIYKFEFINIHAGTSDKRLLLTGSTNGGSSYGVTKTTTAFLAYHSESDVYAELIYGGSSDLAQSTSGQRIISTGMGSNADDNACGEMFLFNPSSTTFVKHFLIRTIQNDKDPNANDTFISGYFNTTSAINAIQFIQNSGTVDGTIKLYGIKDS